MKDLGKLIKIDKPSDNFTDKVMNLCYSTEVKKPFDIFEWLRDKHTLLVLNLTTSIVNYTRMTISNFKLETSS